MNNESTPSTHEGATQRLRHDTVDKMAQICKRLKKACPTDIIMADGQLRQIDSRMLSRFQWGTQYTVTDWYRLLDLLVPPAANKFCILVTNGDKLPSVDVPEIFVWVHELATTATKLSRMSWCFTLCRPYTHRIDTYSVGRVEYPEELHAHIAAAFGEHKQPIAYTYHPATNIISDNHIAFSDAVLLDMLLDVIAGDSEPRQRHKKDGLLFQLEILQAVDKAHKVAEYTKAGFEAAAEAISIGSCAPASSSDRVPIGNRFKGNNT